MNRQLSKLSVGLLGLALLSAIASPACKNNKQQVGDQNTTTEQISQSNAGKESPKPSGKNKPPKKRAKTDKAPMLPAQGGDFAPALTKIDKEHGYHADMLADSKTCSECHTEIVDQWQQSAHAFASLNNPIYRVAFEAFHKSRGGEKTQFCAGCHDPAMLFDSSVKEKDVLGPDDKRGHLGVTCNVCHSASDATNDGNGSYTLTMAPIPLPKDGDDASLQAHKKRMAPAALRSNALCVSCHRGFLSPAMGHDIFLIGIDEWGPWRGSGHKKVGVGRIDPEAPKNNCVGCHMPRFKDSEGVMRASHRFPGGHNSLASALGSKAQQEANAKLLEDVVDMHLYTVQDLKPDATNDKKDDKKTKPDSTTSDKDDTLRFDVVVFNKRGGHAFPGGARDLRDTWLEVELRDSKGAVIGVSGSKQAESGDDDSAHIFHVMLTDKSGMAQTDHTVSHFRTPAFNHTIPPRNAVVVRYEYTLPDGFDASRLPLKADVRMRHRRLSLSMQKHACEAQKTARGKKFVAATKKYTGESIDICATQPILELEKGTRYFGPGAEAQQPKPSLPEHQYHYMHGLALLNQVQERIDESRAAFQRALETIPEDAPKHQFAAIHLGLAQVDARQGKPKDAHEKFEKARSYFPKHPSLGFGIGQGYMRTWTFDKAAEAFSEAGELLDEAIIWRKLAIALGSQSRHIESLEAAHKGLRLEPRNYDLLRSQMLAYRNLDVPREWVEQSEKAFNSHKRDEKAPHIRDACSSNSPRCLRERVAVHTHKLRAPK